MKKNIVETTAGTYELIKNHKEAFDIVKFQERYVEEIYDKMCIRDRPEKAQEQHYQ